MEENKDFPIKGWKWIFYTTGWTSGIINPVFWVTMYILHIKNDKEENFINNNFHIRVFKWGVVVSIITVVLLLLFLIFVWVLLKYINTLSI